MHACESSVYEGKGVKVQLDIRTSDTSPRWVVAQFVGASLRGRPAFSRRGQYGAPTEGRPYKLGHYPPMRTASSSVRNTKRPAYTAKAPKSVAKAPKYNTKDPKYSVKDAKYSVKSSKYNVKDAKYGRKTSKFTVKDAEVQRETLEVHLERREVRRKIPEVHARPGPRTDCERVIREGVAPI